MIAVCIENNDDLDAYDRRLRLTVLAFGFGVLALLAPLATQVGSPGRHPV